MSPPRLDEGSEREAYPPLPEAEDFMYQHEETGITGYIDAQQVEWGFFKNNPRLHKVHGVYNEAKMRAYVDADRASRAALSTGRLGGEVPAPQQHRNFMLAYYKAASSSQAQDWLDAALMAKQWECAITNGAFDDEFRAPAAQPQGDSNA